MADVERLLADLARWQSDAAVDAAVAARVRERWMRQLASEEATFAGLLLDLVERGLPTAVRTTSGHAIQGTVVAVGRDFTVVRSPEGPPTIVALAAVVSVRTESGPPAASARSTPLDVRMAHLLAGLAGERPRVRVVAEGGGDPVAGDLWAVGDDVLSLRLDGRSATVHFRLDAVGEVTLLG